MNSQCVLVRAPRPAQHDPRVSRYVTHINKGKAHTGGLNGPRAMARRARQACRIETRELRARLAELNRKIAAYPYWGAGLTARNEERAELVRNIMAIEARYA